MQASRRPTRVLVGICFIGLSVSTALAADAEAEDARVEALRQQFEQQQRRINVLEASDAAAQDVEAERMRAMRDEIKRILSDPDFRESLRPTSLLAGYDRGFYLKSSDSNYSFKVNGIYQFRFGHYGTRQDNRYLLPRLRRDDRTGFEVARMRFTFSGTAFNPRLTYQVMLRSDSGQSNDTILHYAWFNYKFDDAIQVKLGRFRLSSTRAQVLSDSTFQFIDRPMVDAVFGLDVGTGVRFWGQLPGKRIEYFIDVVNSLNGPNNRVITNDPSELDSNPAILARTVWHALGEDLTMGETEGDVELHKNPHLDFGAHYAFNEDDGDNATTRIPFNRSGLFGFFRPGGFGLATSNGARIHQLGLDTVFKWNGFSFQGEYIVRFIDIRQAWDRPFAPLWRLTGEESTTAMQGAYVQAGYFLPIPGMERKLEAVGRVGGICTNVGGNEGAWEYTGGLNYYFDGHRVKLVSEISKVTEAPISAPAYGLPNVNDDILMYRMQFQVAF